MNIRIANIWKFLTYDIWRITENEVTKTTYAIYNIIKTVYICITRFAKERLISKASSLTYSTLLAIVPILAVLFAIARGFGFDNVMEECIRNNFGGSPEAAEAILSFAQSYLSQTDSGVFLGFGLVMLFWTVINLVMNIEITFNRIWEVKRERSVYRQVTDFFSLILLIPILIVISAGLSIFTTTKLREMENFSLLAPILQFLIRLIPYIFTWLMFTGLYVFMPNTRVKFKHALIAGVIAGTAFQTFQYVYINSQLWVSKYNAIYGSFAALPLFLLWLHISWIICLFGAELTYAGQNIKNFNFEWDTRNISLRYRDFIVILIMSLITKKFERNEPPYTAAQLSEENRIPLRLTRKTLYLLQEIGVIHEVANDRKSKEAAYQPSMDINQLSVGMVLHRLYTKGSENFKIDKEKEFGNEWKVLAESTKEYYSETCKVLLKDL